MENMDSVGGPACSESKISCSSSSTSPFIMHDSLNNHVSRARGIFTSISLRYRVSCGWLIYVSPSRNSPQFRLGRVSHRHKILVPPICCLFLGFTETKEKKGGGERKRTNVRSATRREKRLAASRAILPRPSVAIVGSYGDIALEFPLSSRFFNRVV